MWNIFGTISQNFQEVKNVSYYKYSQGVFSWAARIIMFCICPRVQFKKRMHRKITSYVLIIVLCQQQMCINF